MKTHILEQNDGEFKAVIHFAVPGTSNSAGVPWSECIVNSGRNTSSLAVGNGAGQITQAEMDDITAGTVLEITASLRIKSGGATAANVDDMVDREISRAQDTLAQVYEWFGHTQDDIP